MKLPDGGTAILCGGHRGKKQPKCACGRPGTRQCDAPVERTVKGWAFKGATCDVYICEYCSTNDGPNRDLCRDHKALKQSA